MATQKTLGYSTNPKDLGVSFKSLLSTHFVVKRDDPGECILTNTDSPIDQPETIRFAAQELSNVYAGTSIEPTNYYAVKKGSSIVMQVKDIIRVTDSSDPTFRVDVPIEAHIVVRVPKTPYVSVNDVRDIINRAYVATLPYDINNDNLDTVGFNNRLEELIRGALVPSKD